MPPKKKAAPEPKKPAYRPPRVPLTQQLVAEIVDLIEKGAYPLSAARAVGIPRRTWYEWLAAGEKGVTAETSALSHAIEKARGRLATKYYATINTAAIGHEEPMRDAKGNVIFTTDERGKPVPFMVKVPGQWTAAARALESLSPDEFLRQTGGSPKGGAGEGDADGSGPDFEIVYLPSNRDPKELAEINRRIERRASGASANGKP